MVKIFCILVLLSSGLAYADFFGLGGGEFKSKLPDLVEKIKKLDQSNNPQYEDAFNDTVKEIENALEEEKLVCSGESSDVNGKTIAKEQKQLCFRDLKNNYLEAADVIFDLKKKYLGLVHARQMDRLGVIQKKLKADIDKSF